MWPLLFALDVIVTVPPPVTCFVAASDDTSLGDRRAVELCRGARSAAPARCAAAAEDRTSISDALVVRLCRRARSLAPATCVTRLEGKTALADSALVEYCAAEPGLLIARRRAGDPGCVEAALEETALEEREARRLCRGAKGSSPVDCFVAGDHDTALSSRQLVRLCAPVTVARLGDLDPTRVHRDGVR